PRVGPGVWLVPRGELGATVLFPTGDLDTYLNTLKDACNTSNSTGCDSFGGPRPGFNAGLGFGALFAVSPSVRLRADLLAQFYVINLYTGESPSGFGGSQISRSLTGSRFYLKGGVEF